MSNCVYTSETQLSAIAQWIDIPVLVNFFEVRVKELILERAIKL